mgnify:CR=1 FL=1
MDRLFSHIFHCNLPQNPLQFVEEEQHGENRAAYGKQLIKELSAYLTKHFGKGFSVANLKNIRQFYKVYSTDQIGETVFSQFENLPSVNTGRKFYLSWSHYLVLMRISNEDARHFYEIEAVKNDWSLSQLKRQYGSSRNTPRASWKAASSTISSSSFWNSVPALRSWAAKSASRLTRSISSWTWCFTTGFCAASSSLRRTACRITSSNLTKFYTRTLLHNQPITSHSKPRTTQARSGPVPGKMPVTPPPVLVSVNPQLRLTVQNPKTRSVWLWLPNSLPAARSWSPRLAPR